MHIDCKPLDHGSSVPFALAGGVLWQAQQPPSPFAVRVLENFRDATSQTILQLPFG